MFHRDDSSQGTARGNHIVSVVLASCCGADTTHKARKGEDRQGLEEATGTEVG